MPDPDPRARRPACPRRLHRTLLALMSAAALSGAHPAMAQPDTPASTVVAPVWDHELELGADAGYAQLRWLPPASDDSVDWLYQLQEGRRPEFAAGDREYQGHHTSSFVSGLENGAYYFRVRARRPGDPEDAWGAWSNTVRVDVTHHSRQLALALMALGGLVFLATAAFLIVHRNDPIEDPAAGTTGGGA